MNIALIGYGKMGREIARIAKSKGHDITLVIDINNSSDLNEENLSKTDVAIEFSAPDIAFNNIISCLKAGTPVVSGTTGWLHKWDEAVKYCDKYDGSLFYASNFSIGVNILFAMNKLLANIMRNFPQYTVSIEEIHHIHKLDAPSGTAISLAQQIINELPGKQEWNLHDNHDLQKDSSIPIKAIREGEVNGYHKIKYDSEVDTITIDHNAKSREGFASGALMAADYLIGKKGIHSMNDLLNI